MRSFGPAPLGTRLSPAVEDPACTYARTQALIPIAGRRTSVKVIARLSAWRVIAEDTFPVWPLRRAPRANTSAKASGGHDRLSTRPAVVVFGLVRWEFGDGFSQGQIDLGAPDWFANLDGDVS